MLKIDIYKTKSKQKTISVYVKFRKSEETEAKQKEGTKKTKHSHNHIKRSIPFQLPHVAYMLSSFRAQSVSFRRKCVSCVLAFVLPAVRSVAVCAAANIFI